MTLKEHQLRAHFDRFIDRDARYPGYILTDEAWRAFKKSESYGKKSLTSAELELGAPLFGAKWSYEITIQQIWQELADCWSSGFGWDAPLRATISDVWQGREYDREGIMIKRPEGNRVYLRALFKIRRALKQDFIAALMAYTGLSREDKERYLLRWEQTNAAHLS